MLWLVSITAVIGVVRVVVLSGNNFIRTWYTIVVLAATVYGLSGCFRWVANLSLFIHEFACCVMFGGLGAIGAFVVGRYAVAWRVVWISMAVSVLVANRLGGDRVFGVRSFEAIDPISRFGHAARIAIVLGGSALLLIAACRRRTVRDLPDRLSLLAVAGICILGITWSIMTATLLAAEPALLARHISALEPVWTVPGYLLVAGCGAIEPVMVGRRRMSAESMSGG